MLEINGSSDFLKADETCIELLDKVDENLEIFQKELNLGINSVEKII